MNEKPTFNQRLVRLLTTKILSNKVRSKFYNSLVDEVILGTGVDYHIARNEVIQHARRLGWRLPEEWNE